MANSFIKPLSNMWVLFDPATMEPDPYFIFSNKDVAEGMAQTFLSRGRQYEVRKVTIYFIPEPQNAEK